jgi:hypothetical protein
MVSLCDSLDQKELIRFWIEELTDFTPQQVDAVVEQMKTKGKKVKSLSTKGA